MSIQVILVLINCLLAYLCTAIDVEKVVNRTAFHVIKTLLVSIPKSPRTIKSESIKTDPKPTRCSEKSGIYIEKLKLDVNQIKNRSHAWLHISASISMLEVGL